MKKITVLVFVLAMGAAAVFLANYRKEEIPVPPPQQQTELSVDPSTAAQKGTAIIASRSLIKHFLIDPAQKPQRSAKPASAPPSLPGPKSVPPPPPPAFDPYTSVAAPGSAPAAEPQKPAGDPDSLVFTVSSYKPAAESDKRHVIQEEACVEVTAAGAKEAATKGMDGGEALNYGRYYDYAVLFLKSSCRNYVASAGPFLFVRQDGEALPMDRAYGFIFFDGRKDPRAVRAVQDVKAEYNSYFGIPAGGGD